jgi:hypothetical protein
MPAMGSRNLQLATEILLARNKKCVNLHIIINPILHTARLNNHALTLRRNTAKYYFGEKSSFAYLPKSLL